MFAPSFFTTKGTPTVYADAWWQPGNPALAFAADAVDVVALNCAQEPGDKIENGEGLF